MLTVVVVDAGKHTTPQVEALRLAQGKKILEGIPEGAHPDLAKELKQQAKKWAKMSNQLALQAHLMTCLVESALRTLPDYFAQCDPAELGAFTWVVDAKDQKLSPFEKQWELLVGLFLQSVFLNKPYEPVVGAGVDYKHVMDAFHVDVATLPTALAKHLPLNDPTEQILDLKKLLSVRCFRSSDAEPGLQLADIVAGAARRAMLGKLGDSSWSAMARLLVKGETPAIRPITFAGEQAPAPGIARARKIADALAQPFLMQGSPHVGGREVAPTTRPVD